MSSKEFICFISVVKLISKWYFFYMLLISVEYVITSLLSILIFYLLTCVFLLLYFSWLDYLEVYLFFQKACFWFPWSFLQFLFLLIISFLLLTLVLICSSFSGFLRWIFRSLILSLSSFLIHIFKVKYLSTASAKPHRFLCVFILIHFKTTLNFPVLLLFF